MSMTAEQFKEIRVYLNAQRYKGQKWSQEYLGRVLLSTRVTVTRWEAGETTIPTLVAERMQELLLESGLEQARNQLFRTLKSKVHTPRDLDHILHKIQSL